jgi:hypothetical protein
VVLPVVVPVEAVVPCTDDDSADDAPTLTLPDSRNAKPQPSVTTGITECLCRGIFMTRLPAPCSRGD